MKLSRTVQQYVKGEAPSTQYGIFSVGTKVDELGEPEVPVHTTEPLLTDKTDPAEELQKGKAVPISKSQQRRFSVDWDPIQYTTHVRLSTVITLTSSQPSPSN